MRSALSISRAALLTAFQPSRLIAAFSPPFPTLRATTRMTSSSVKATERPFGAWDSPVTSQAITAGSVRLSDLFLKDNNGSDQLYWLEGRPQEGGRNVLCQWTSDERRDVSPADFNIRTRVHEYGGGAVTMARDKILVCEFATQHLCELVTTKEEEGVCHTVSPPLLDDDKKTHRYRFADGVLSNDGTTWYGVCEDHGPEGTANPADVVNQIVTLNLSTATIQVVASGNDFYAAPRLSPDGTQLAYVTWNHPNMPWDCTELRMVETTSKNSDSAQHVLVAGEDGDTSILQPLWNDNGDLYFLSDTSGYYNLYRYRDNKVQPVLSMDYDWGGSSPGWSLGQQGYTFLPHDGRLAAHYTKDGQSVLLLATIVDGKATNVVEYGTEHGLPMQFGAVQGSFAGGDLYFVGGSPSTPTSIYKWNVQDQGPAQVLVCSSTLTFPDSVISVPQPVEFPTTSDNNNDKSETAFGYYYPPKNDAFQCTTAKPPLLVKAHGGPTSCARTSFSASIQFWTSRGFGVLDVDYRGSTGYGRSYRRRLARQWGVVDIQDVCAGALYLVEQGLVDGQRLCIDGGSAGGYTTLGALAFQDVFHAGCSLYGIGDLTALAGDTHKFESRYLDGLVGEYPKEEALYKQRSPIESVETLSCPILLLQGEEDKIVPPNQAEKMHQALLKKGIPTCLKLYAGEQHGFRKAENIEDALDSELAFFGKVFGIEVPGAVDLKIDNL